MKRKITITVTWLKSRYNSRESKVLVTPRAAKLVRPPYIVALGYNLGFFEISQ